MGGAWLIGGFAATIWLPVRSSLLAVFPSVGLALAVGTLLAATARNAAPQRAWRVAVAGVILPFLLLPIYWQRNVRWTGLRDLSAATTGQYGRITCRGNGRSSSKTISRRARTSVMSSAASFPKRRHCCSTTCRYGSNRRRRRSTSPQSRPEPDGSSHSGLVAGRVELARPASVAND